LPGISSITVIHLKCECLQHCTSWFEDNVLCPLRPYKNTDPNYTSSYNVVNEDEFPATFKDYFKAFKNLFDAWGNNLNGVGDNKPTPLLDPSIFNPPAYNNPTLEAAYQALLALRVSSFNAKCKEKCKK